MQNDKDIELKEISDAIRQFEIGVDYYKGRNGKKQDRSKAVMWYRKSAEQKHPDLVPYTALPEGEKGYDRLMAYNTIKLVKKLGFDIVKRNK